MDDSSHLRHQLYAKNKTEVKRWLQSQKGAEAVVDRGILARIAEPPESVICDLLLEHGKGKLSSAVVQRLQHTPVDTGRLSHDLDPF